MGRKNFCPFLYLLSTSKVLPYIFCDIILSMYPTEKLFACNFLKRKTLFLLILFAGFFPTAFASADNGKPEANIAETAAVEAHDLCNIFAEGVFVLKDYVKTGIRLSSKSYQDLYKRIEQGSGRTKETIALSSAASDLALANQTSVYCKARALLGLGCDGTTPTKVVPPATPAVQQPVKSPSAPILAPPTVTPTQPSSPAPVITGNQVLSYDTIVASPKNVFAPASTLNALSSRVGNLEKKSGSAQFVYDTQARIDILALQKKVEGLRSSPSHSSPTAYVGLNGQAVVFNAASTNGVFEKDVSAQTGTFSGGVTSGSLSASKDLTVTGNSTLSGSLSVGGATTLTGTLSANGVLYTDGTNSRVGVGTSSPSDTLSVNGPLYLTAAIPSKTTNRLYNILGSLYWGGNLIAGATTGNWTASGEDAWRTTGKVGIGTTSPAYTLDVGGNINIGNGYTFKYDGTDLITANKTLGNSFFGLLAGNTTMTGG